MSLNKNFFRKLVLASVLSLGLFTIFGAEQTYALNCTNTKCADQCADFNETQQNVSYYCDCWACIYCSSAIGKHDQATTALMLCMGLA